MELSSSSAIAVKRKGIKFRRGDQNGIDFFKLGNPCTYASTKDEFNSSKDDFLIHKSFAYLREPTCEM